MIRFLDLSDQITKGTNEFAFYDTVTDSFLRFKGTDTWEHITDFKDDYDGDDVDRFLKLIPASWDSEESISGELTFEFKNGDPIILGVLQSPRGIRFYNQRPHYVKLKISGRLSKVNFTQLVKWLEHISMSFY